MMSALADARTPAARETIAAVATPPGVGGIAVVRVSGPRAQDIALSLLGGCSRRLRPRHAHYGVLRDADGVIDDGLILWMPGPRSYTGEDVVEFQIHGSPVLARRLLRACYAQGARPAEPGEFTERAYRNGRIDLAQAEAVADLIHAQTERAARLARASLDGALARRIEPLRQPLRELRAWVEADLDFGETDLDGADDLPADTPPASGTVEAAIRERLRRLRTETEHLLDVLSRNRLHRDGVKVVIVGAPNVGKSSLLNAWIGEDRAIVTDVAGTTRDLIDASFVAGDWWVRVLDTAGLRDTADVVERIGIERSLEAAAAADVVLWVADCSRPAETAPPWWTPADPARDTPHDGQADRRRFAGIAAHDRPWLVVWNKADLADPPAGPDSTARRNDASRPCRYVVCAVSAVTGAGVDDLATALTRLLTDLPARAACGSLVGGDSDARSASEAPTAGRPVVAEEAAFSVRERHLDALTRFAQALADAERAPFADLRAEHLRQAERALDRLFGHSDVEDLLGAIFRGFCIGK